MRSAYYHGETGVWQGYPSGVQKASLIPADQQRGLASLGLFGKTIFLLGEGMFMMQKQVPFMRYVTWPVFALEVAASQWVIWTLFGLIGP
jgi:hypothetical protein